MLRRSFLKACAAAALCLSNLLPDLAPANDWGFRRRPFRPEDYTLRFEYVPLYDLGPGCFDGSGVQRITIPLKAIVERAS